MDAVIAHQSLIEDALSDAVRPKVNAELSVVFDDMTTIARTAQSPPH
jgi:hypothetical protein